jgi:ParB-like chromosome segregation protein Spo0J
MIQSAETRLDGNTLVVRIPMRFQRRGGRKRIVATDGREIALATKPRPDGTLLKALARAHRWQRMLDEGLFASLAELADAERISRSYVSRILRLTLLVPDIVERILDGRPTAGLARFLKPFPFEWERQRERFL